MVASTRQWGTEQWGTEGEAGLGLSGELNVKPGEGGSRKTILVYFF